MQLSEFFLPGPVVDPAYLHTRDEPSLADAKQLTERLWKTYEPYADNHFREDARSHFLQRFWEMYLACSLLDRGLELQRFGGAGPEFYFYADGTRVWVEAVAPGPGEGLDRVPEIRSGEMYEVPVEKIILRFTHVLLDKGRRIDIALQRGIVCPEDIVILAINSRGIPHAPYGGEMPYFLKALLPFGQLTFDIDRDTTRCVRSYHQYRTEVHKENGSVVSTAPFLDSVNCKFAAVLHSGVDCANHPDRLGDDFVVLHSPVRDVGLSDSVFDWCRQFRYGDGTLRELE